MSNFNERLKELMQEKELTSTELGNSLNISQSIVSRWSNSKSIKLSNAVKLAEYFDVSLDYLSGRTDNDVAILFQKCPLFYPQVKKVISSSNKTLYQIDKESHIKKAHFRRWAKGSEPLLFTLVSLADYLDISLDYLVGRTKA